MNKRGNRSEPRLIRRQRVARALRAAEEDIARMSQEDVQKLVHDLQTHQAELEMQNEELRTIQLDLQSSRDQYSDLYDFAPIGYLTLDRKGTIRRSNLTGAALLGTERLHLLGTPLSRFVSKDDVRRYHLHLRATFKQISRQVCELALNRGDDTLIHVRLESVVHGSTARPGECLTALSNVTDRKRAEQDLIESQQLLRSTLDSLSAQIAILDAAGSVIAANAAWHESASANRSAMPRCLIGTNYVEACTQVRGEDEGFAQAATNAIKAVASGRCDHFQMEYPGRRASSTRFFAMRLNRFVGKGPARIVVVHEDITERKRTEEERRRLDTAVRHQQKLESLALLAGGAAHDFNNLLVGILGCTGLLQLSLPPESPAREAVNHIEHAAARAADLANQMLAYAGRGRLRVEPLDLSSLIWEMVDLLRSAVSKKATVEFDLLPNLPAVDVDATQIRQLVMNLVTNASDAVDAPGGTIIVRTGVVCANRAMLSEAYVDDQLPEGRYVFIDVNDNGSGMDSGTVARIFDPFFTTKFTGRGLGLAAALGIVRGHKGVLKVTSQPGEGSTFRILLPFSATPASAAPKVGVKIAAKPNDHDRRTILVVDDEALVRSVIRMGLESSGCTELTAADGREGIELFREKAEGIAAVVLDMTMPKLGGGEVLAEIHRIRSDVPVILSSGYSEEDAAHKLIDAAGFLRKPYRLPELLQKLDDALNKAGERTPRQKQK